MHIGFGLHSYSTIMWYVIESISYFVQHRNLIDKMDLLNLEDMSMYNKG